MDPLRAALLCLCDALDGLPGPLGPHTRTAVQEARFLLQPLPASASPPPAPARPAAPPSPPPPGPGRRPKGV